MLTKSHLKIIIFISKSIIDTRRFTDELYVQVNQYLSGKITTDNFETWLYSWEATAELDLDPLAKDRIKKSFAEIKAGKTPHKSWKEFKDSIGLP